MEYNETQQAAIEAIEAGATTAGEIEDAIGRDTGHTNRILRGLVDDGVLVRTRSGRSYTYSVADGTAPVANDVATAAPATPTPTTGNGTGGLMPVDREYDFDREIPSVDNEYVAANGEWTEINALIDARETIGRFPRFLVGGPTGCGKTTLVETVAAQRNWPLFTLQMRYSVREKDLVGSPSIINGNTMWNDGTLVKALLASRDRPVVLLVDEANRARPESKSILFSALDHRCRIVLDGPRGGELIQGNPMNLIVFATINEGSEYFGTQKMDMAEKRRFGARYNVDYLGVNYPDREAGLVAGAAGVGHSFADALVEAANAVRKQAKDGSNVSAGVPTSAVIAWAQASRAFEDANVANPVIAAAMSEVVRPFYDGVAADNVMSTIETHLNGASVADFDAWNDDTEVVCDDCSYRADYATANENGVLTDMVCPNCGNEPVRMVDAGN